MFLVRGHEVIVHGAMTLVLKNGYDFSLMELGDERKGTPKPKRQNKPRREDEIIQSVLVMERAKVWKVVGQKTLKKYFSAQGDCFHSGGV